MHQCLSLNQQLHGPTKICISNISLITLVILMGIILSTMILIGTMDIVEPLYSRHFGANFSVLIRRVISFQGDEVLLASIHKCYLGQFQEVVIEAFHCIHKNLIFIYLLHALCVGAVPVGIHTSPFLPSSPIDACMNTGNKLKNSMLVSILNYEYHRTSLKWTYWDRQHARIRLNSFLTFNCSLLASQFNFLS